MFNDPYLSSYISAIKPNIDIISTSKSEEGNVKPILVISLETIGKAISRNQIMRVAKCFKMKEGRGGGTNWLFWSSVYEKTLK